MKNIKILFLIAALAINAFAHTFWINLSEHTVHRPGHLLVNVGWGHQIPIDDMVNSENGSVNLQKFQMMDENGVSKLYFPEFSLPNSFLESDKFSIFQADFAFNKISLKKDMPKNVIFEAVTKHTFVTQCIDQNGKSRMNQKPLDEISDASKVLFALKYQAFAKRYLNFNSELKPLGHALEIMPRGNISNLKVGDEVEFEVLFNGKKISVSDKMNEFIRADNENLGQVGGTAYYSFLMNGVAKIRLTHPGEWVVSISYNQSVTKDGELKELFGKTKNVFHMASLAFNVKER